MNRTHAPEPRHKRRRTLASFALFCALAPILATGPLAAAAWRSIGPGGGYINSPPLVAPSDNQVAFVIGDDRVGTFRTADGGRSWSHVEVRSNLRPLSLVAIDPRNARSLAGVGTFANRSHLIASRDGGARWRLVSDGLPVDSNGHVDLYGGFAFDPVDSSHWLAGTSQGLFESRDGGAHWTSAGFAGATVIAIGAAAPNEIWAALSIPEGEGDRFEIRRSRDGGTTWTPVERPTEVNLGNVRFRFDPRSPGRPYLIGSTGLLLHRTAAGWSRLRPAPQTYDLTVLKGGTLVAATDQGVRTSRDGGRTWSGGGRPALVYLATVGPREILGTGEYGVWRSTDGGRIFRASSRGLDAQGINTFAVAADGALWAGMHGPGLMRTIDRGADWTRQLQGLGIDPQERPPIPGDFATSPSQPDTLYVALGFFGETKLARTRDGGTTWAYATLPFSTLEYGIVRLAIDAQDPERILVAAVSAFGPLSSFVWRSDDAGRSWSAPFTFRQRAFILDFVLDPVDPRIAFALSTDGLWKSRDGGRTFSRVARDLPLQFTNGFTLAIDPERHDNIYIAGAIGIFASRDGGETFERLGAELPGAGQRGIGTASGGRLLIASIERGVELWHPESGCFEPAGTGLPLEVFNARILVDPSDRGTVYAATFGRSLWRLDLDE